MLNTLPIEIVDLVLDKVGKPPTIESDNWERARTLYSCCLVCRGWRELAQPKLWQKMDTKFSEKADEVERLLDERREDLRRAVRVLTVRLNVGDEDERLCSTIGRFIGLEEVSLEGTGRDFDLGVLQALPRLRRLHLWHTQVSSLPSNFALSALVELDFYGTTIDEALARIIFSSRSLPALRALSLDDIHPLQGDNFTHTLSPAFVQQLDILVTGDNAPCPLISLQSPTPVLLRVNFARLNANEADAYLQTLIAHRARHVSLALVSVDKEHALSRLRNLVQSASRPRSLHLPLSRHLAETETAESLLLSLVQACGECGVDLIWYVPEGEWDISPDSWAYARKLKAEDASKKADKEASGQRG